MFIYLIANHVSGKYYVGQHKGNNLKHYLQQKMYAAWYYKGHSHLFAAMRKYPRDSWSIHALRSDIQTREELDQTERDFIKFLRAQDPEYGYNILLGGQEGFIGIKPQEIREKMSHSMKEVWSQPGYKERLVAKFNDPEVRQRFRESRIGQKASPETREKMSLASPLKGVPCSEERKQNLRIKNSGNGGRLSALGRKWIYNPILQMEKLAKPEELDIYLSSGWVLGGDPQRIAQMAVSKTGKTQSPETCQKRNTKLRGKKRTEETKKRMSEAAKRRGVPHSHVMLMVAARKSKQATVANV